MRGPVLIASRRPIKRLRTIAWAEGIMLILLEVDAGQNEPLQILIADFPSDPRRARAQVAATAARLLQELPHPTDARRLQHDPEQFFTEKRDKRLGTCVAGTGGGVGRHLAPPLSHLQT